MTWIQGIQFFYIMPGSSHWLQIHDQTPFHNLKKMMGDQKSETMPSDSVAPDGRKMISITVFCNAERRAFTISTMS